MFHGVGWLARTVVAVGAVTTSAGRAAPCTSTLLRTASSGALRTRSLAMKDRRDGKQDGFRNPHNLPVKTCVVCNRPFTWRKKWEDSWDEVTTCSKSCNAERKRSNRADDPRETSSSDGELGEASSSEDSRSDGRPSRRSGRRSPRMVMVSENESADTAELGMTAPAILMGSECADGHGAEQNPNGQGAEQDPSGMAGDHGAEQDPGGMAGDHGAELDPRSARKAAKKASKAERRAKREGTAGPIGQKACDLCMREVDLLIRCQLDSAKQWKMVCGRCWKTPAVANGVVDGDPLVNPHYRYGGLWKNLHRVAQ